MRDDEKRYGSRYDPANDDGRWWDEMVSCETDIIDDMVDWETDIIDDMVSCEMVDDER